MKPSAAAKRVQGGIEEALTYMDFPTQHWTRIRTNNTIERLNREIKCRTRAIGAFPDAQSALVLVCARLRRVTGTQWGTKRYMNRDHLYTMVDGLFASNLIGTNALSAANLMAPVLSVITFRKYGKGYGY